jgi:hypothetical protein
MARTVIDWFELGPEKALEELKRSPRIAGVWRYSENIKGYSRYLEWDPKKGKDVSWLIVANVWSNNKQWYASYVYGGGDEYQRRVFGPFTDRFEVARIIDDFLEKEGWMVCK